MTSVSNRRRVPVAWALLVFGCGARTPLDEIEAGAVPCEEPGTVRRCQTICGEGVETCTDGFWRGCTAPKPKSPRLPVVIRDHSDGHPDFESGALADDRGIVESTLGLDDKPVYAGRPTTPTTHGKEAFDTWYRDLAGINVRTEQLLDFRPISNSPVIFEFADPEYFPIDGALLGNEGRDHNYHFTVELVARFRYVGGEWFRFEGDDDVWVFLNRRLAIDLGGVHSTETAAVSLDDRAEELGLVRGRIHPLHLFFAERQTTGSSFRIETSIAEFDQCD